jgi:hypothetical protein
MDQTSCSSQVKMPAGAQAGRIQKILRQAFVDKIPVDELVDHRGQIIRAAVLIIEIIGVFPDVQRQKGLEAVSDRRIGIGRFDNLQLPVVEYEPGPAAAELGCTRCFKLFREFVVAAPGRINLRCNCPGGGAAATRLQALPVK